MKHPSDARIFTDLFPNRASVYVAFCGILIAGILYVFYVGAQAVWPDSLFFADRARHVIGQGSLARSAALPAMPPLYSVLMSVAFAFPDMLSGHNSLVIIQALVIGSAFFPLRAMLFRNSLLESGQATLLATGAILLPCFLSYAPLLAPEALLAPILIYAAYFLDRIVAGSSQTADGVGAGMCMGLATLTLYSAGTFWLAALIVLFPLLRQNRAARVAALVPLGLFAIWLVLGGGEGLGGGLSLNNALARFNFGKNALLYLIYGGAPLAGLALLLGGVLKGRRFWDDRFFRFTFLAFAGLALCASLTTGIITEKKLDYFTNRMFEPYLFLPLIVLMRMEESWRKELLGNGLLLFFVLLIFGMPMALHVDFQSGLAFWTGLGITSAAGIIRNALYFALVALPVAALFVRPRWFVRLYTFMLFVFVAVGLSSTAYLGAHNDAAKIANPEAQKIYHDEALQKPGRVYAEYHCKGAENNDVAYLFGCFDTARALYFLPHLPVYTTAATIAALPAEDRANALFVSSENDNAFGPVIAQLGLARFQKMDAAAPQTLVQVKRITGMKEYVDMPFLDRTRRLTMLDPSSGIALQSSAAACMRMEALWLMDNKTQAVSLQLDNGAVSKITVPMIKKGPMAPVSIKLNLPKGASFLKITYGAGENKDAVTPPSLIMFDRPVFKSCGGK